MVRLSIHHPIRTALLISAMYFLIHFFLMKDYGVSWDFHYHHYAGLYHLGLPVPSINDTAPVPFSPPDPRLTTQDPFGPFTQILPTLSHEFFFTRLHILPFDRAYNLPIVLSGALGIGLLFVLLFEMFGPVHAWVGAVFLALFPVHVAYLHTNMKDVPNALAFTLSVYLFWRLAQKGGWGRLIVAAVSFAIAFNIKINSILIPVVCGGFSAWHLAVHRFRGLKWMIGYAAVAPAAAVALWWPFWEFPWEKLAQLPSFYSRNTLDMPVLFFGRMYRSGVNIPWYYPFGYLAVTTPLPILFGFLIGSAVLGWKLLKRDGLPALLLIWFIIPISRYMLPHTAAIDGVRHFLEIVYPLCAISAVGWATIMSNFTSHISNEKIQHNRWIIPMIILLPVLSSLIATVRMYHPYQASFFNSFVGGIRGAQGKFDIDFWGTPQKEAITWINDHAREGSSVHIIMAQSSAAMYLRTDLLPFANSRSKEESDYTVLLNRESFFDLYGARTYLDAAKRDGRIVYTRAIDDVPLVWVMRNR